MTLLENTSSISTYTPRNDRIMSTDKVSVQISRRRKNISTAREPRLSVHREHEKRMEGPTLSLANSIFAVDAVASINGFPATNRLKAAAL